MKPIAEKTNTTGSSVGVDQSTLLSNKNNYFNLFPQVQLSYEVDKKNVLNLSYNRGIHRPDYQDINPFLYYTDLYDYNSGNPNLKPEYTNSIQLSHTYNSTFITTLYYNVTNSSGWLRWVFAVVVTFLASQMIYNGFMGKI